MPALKKLDEKLEEYLLVASLSAILVIVFLQVIFRYVLGTSMGGSEEIARYILIWIIWISASYAVKTNRHIRVEYIKKFIPSSVEKGLEIAVLLVWFCFALFLAINGTGIVQKIEMTGQTSPSNSIPMWIAYLVIPVSGTLMGIRIIQQIYYVLKGKAPRREEELDGGV